MINKVKKIIEQNMLPSIGIIICLFIISGYTYTKFMPKWFSKTDTYDVVKETFLTNEGYTDELSKHVAPQVFKRTNIYDAYGGLNKKETYKVDFSLKVNSQIKVAGIVYVKMTYSVKVMDLQGKIIGGSSDIPITFTIKNIKGEWYIMEKSEPA
ncbi:hypothetical protein [Clostridium sp.]|uniref:hypothetical protein n=1 Tax=Clostridium sp. TaxID=1506 RepID=UPI003D6D861E